MTQVRIKPKIVSLDGEVMNHLTQVDELTQTKPEIFSIYSEQVQNLNRLFADSEEFSDTEIFSIDREEVQRLNRLFWQVEQSKAAQSVAFSGATLGVGGLIFSGGGVMANPGGGAGAADASAAAAASIAAGVTNAINMIKAIDGIGLAAFGVALAPMGFMVTLRVLNMVLSRV